MTKRTATLLMILAPFLWSWAGVVTKSLHSNDSFETNTWRSLATALAFLLWFVGLHGVKALASVPWAKPMFWITALGWGLMFTTFMLAMVWTSVANVLVMLAAAPLLTAFMSRAITGHELPKRTWMAIVVATLGLLWMFARQWKLGQTQDIVGCAVALLSPLSSAFVWSIAQKHQTKTATQTESSTNTHTSELIPTAMMGSLISALITLAFALPLDMDAHDITLLGLLGFFQLATPCVLLVFASRVLKAAEISLLALLEILFGISLAWVILGQAPSNDVFIGGALVLGALIGNIVFERKDRTS